MTISIVKGRIIVYGSFTIRNPTTLTADFSVQTGGSSGINYFVSPDLYTKSTSHSAGGLGRRKRQAEKNVYLAIVGLMSNNSFTMNTTTGDNVPYATATTATPTSAVTTNLGKQLTDYMNNKYCVLPFIM